MFNVHFAMKYRERCMPPSTKSCGIYHEGASLVVDLQASGSENAPEFHCRLRIDSLKQSTCATALRDLYAADKIPSIHDAYRLNVPQIKAKLTERGETQAMRGKTKKEELATLLHASNARIHAELALTSALLNLLPQGCFFGCGFSSPSL